MVRNLLFILLIPFILSACSNDDPEPDVFMQIESIANEDGYEQQLISYDSYGRVISYERIYPTESIRAEYEYVSDDLIKITTKDIVFDRNGAYDIVRTYQDDLHLENGRAVSCDGIFSQTEPDTAPYEKKYRHEFNYIAGNLLNTVKWTEWNKAGDDWAEDKPWTWENFYYWSEGNLVKVEDYFGHSYPCITYTLKYTDIIGIQNVVPIPMGRHQYFPLQLKGVFGSQPVSLISEIHLTDTFNGNTSSYFQYDIADERVIGFRESHNYGISETFSVHWESKWDLSSY